MILDLKILKLRIDIEIGDALRWGWRYRRHFKRYWKRHIPSLALTCDWCDEPVRALPGMENWKPEGWWLVACRNCSLHGPDGWVTSGPSRRAALERWRRTGGIRFERALPWLHPAPPWAAAPQD